MHPRLSKRVRQVLLAGIMINSLLLVCGVLLFSTGKGNGTKVGNGMNDGTSAVTPTALETEPDQEITITPRMVRDYLINPGIGWQDGPEAFGIMDFPETVDYSDRRAIAWLELNPAKGIYNWSHLDAQLDEAKETGKQFSFRIYTTVGENYDGHMVPPWVLNTGARILKSGEPDFSNCVYQEAWGKFVDELIRKYDGDPNIAYIDISGYGNFNEWSWQDDQTEWDEKWATDYANGTASGTSLTTLDGQARRRLADMFIGGSFSGHACRKPDGVISYVDYSYPGFQKTQLIMPYAGIIQSSQYVYSRRQDIGFRYDCLGRDGRDLFEKIGYQINNIWMKAPIVYELCKPDQMDPEDASWLLRASHASIVHNNNWKYNRDKLEDMMVNVGYRYSLKEAKIELTGHMLEMNMIWQNVGSAPSYPLMGQKFSLYFYLLDQAGSQVLQQPIPVNIAAWMPAIAPDIAPPEYYVISNIQIPSSLSNGTYRVGVSIVDERTAKSIQLAFSGGNVDGIYILSSINIK